MFETIVLMFKAIYAIKFWRAIIIDKLYHVGILFRFISTRIRNRDYEIDINLRNWKHKCLKSKEYWLKPKFMYDSCVLTGFLQFIARNIPFKMMTCKSLAFMNCFKQHD